MGETHFDPADPNHTEDPDWEELDEIADASRDESESVAASVKSTLDAVSTKIAGLDAQFDLDHLEKVSLADPSAAPDWEDWSDSTDSASYDKLTKTLTTVLGSTTADQRKLARAKFVAMQFGYAAEGGSSGSDADRLITLLSLAAARTPDRSVDAAVADAVQSMADTWTAQSAGDFWGGMADRFDGVLLDRDELGEHMVWMGLVSELSPVDDGWLWSSKADLAPLVEQLIGEQISGWPVDPARIYENAQSLTYGPDKTPIPKAVAAELVRLAFGALARPERRATVNDRVAATAASIEADTKKDVADLLGGAKGLPRSSLGAYEFRYDLSEYWQHALTAVRGGLRGLSDGKNNVSKLDAALVGLGLGEKLSEWSRLRREGGTADALASAASELSIALAKARANLAELAAGLQKSPDLKDPENLPSYIVAGLVTDPITTLSSELAREGREIGAGESPDGGDRFDGVRELLTYQTDAARAAADAGKDLDTVVTGVTNGLEDTRAWKRNWVQTFNDGFKAWAAAAERGEPATIKDPKGNDVIGVVDATNGLLDAMAAARKSAATLAWGDRAAVERALDTAASAAADWLDAAVTAGDPAATTGSYDTLAAKLRQAMTPLETPDDLSSFWSNGKDAPLNKLPKSQRPSFNRDLRGALVKWATAASAVPRDPDTLYKRSWSVAEILAAYRAEVAQIGDRDVRAQLSRMLDTIAAAIDAKLAEAAAPVAAVAVS